MSMERIILIVLLAGMVLSVWLLVEVIDMIKDDMKKDDYIFKLENRLDDLRQDDDEF